MTKEVSLLESLLRLVDPVAAKAEDEERRRERALPDKPDARGSGPAPTYACRVCGHTSSDASYCPVCLADTMDAARGTGKPPRSQNGDIASEVVLPPDGTLDLHTFRPDEVEEVVLAYFDACLAAGVYSVRVVHGKGTGALRRRVAAILERAPQVAHARPADTTAGGWGATLVELRRP